MTTRVRLPGTLVTGARVEVPEDQAHHLLKVLRKRAGAAVEAVDESGAVWDARIAPGEPLAVEIDRRHEGPSAAPQARVEVWLPLLKGGRTDDLVRQLTELGVQRITPLITRRTVARPDGKRLARQLERWRTVAGEATRQCGRPDVPEIAEPGGLPVGDRAEGPGVFLWEEAREPARLVFGRSGADGVMRVLTGPEGGLDPEEARDLEAAGWQAAWLGPRILRAETAVVVATTLALHALGEGGY